MDGWMDGWMEGWMDGWMDGWMKAYSPSCKRPYAFPPSQGGSASVMAALCEGFERGYLQPRPEGSRIRAKGGR